MNRSLRQIAEAVEVRLQGDGSVEVQGVASIAGAGADDLVFVEDEKYLSRALQSGAGAVIAGDFAVGSVGKPVLICRHPKLAFALAARLLQDKPGGGGELQVDVSAIVHSSAHLAKGVVLEEGVVVGAGVESGEATRIGAGCVIGRGVKIGSDCKIYPQVTIYAST